MNRYQFKYMYEGETKFFAFDAESQEQAEAVAPQRLADIEMDELETISDIECIGELDSSGGSFFNCEGCQ